LAASGPFASSSHAFAENVRDLNCDCLVRFVLAPLGRIRHDKSRSPDRRAPEGRGCEGAPNLVAGRSTNGSKSAGMKRAAAALGMRTVTFTDRYAFRADLDRYGVTVEL
jgi:hypothetical protein